MAARAYRLRMCTPLHVGDQGIGTEATRDYMPSDTLYSALVVMWHTLPHLRPGPADLVKPGQPPPLLISSAFPYAGDVLLLPKPALGVSPKQPEQKEPHPCDGRKPQDDAGKSPPDAKTYKRLRWVSARIFRELTTYPAQSKADPAQSRADLMQGKINTLWSAAVLLQDKAVWIHADEQGQLATLEPDEHGERNIWRTSIAPHVVVDRVTNMPQLFHTGRTSFSRDCGLWFLAQSTAENQAEGEAWLDALEQVLAVLGDEGFGGQRSRGHGQFSVEAVSKLPEFAGAGDYVALLSRMAPTVEQMALLRADHASYELALVGGFSGTPGDAPLVRRQVRMLREGSVIAAPEPGVTLGQLVDVTPEAKRSMLSHAIWRSGFGLAVPVQVGPTPEEVKP